MNILYVLNSGSPGGMEQHVLDLVRGMVANKHKVYVWCRKGEIAGWYKNAGAQVFTHKIVFELDPVYIFKLIRFLKENDIQVLHAHELKAAANALLAGFLAKTPVRITHTHTPISEWRTSHLWQKIIWVPTYLFYAIEVNLFATKEIALTESRKKVKMQEGMFEGRLEVIPNGVDVTAFDIPKTTKVRYKKEMYDKYKIPSNAVVFGNLSRLTEEKGHDVLIKAFANLMRYPIPNKKSFYLVIGGDGHLMKSLKSLAKSLNVADKVVFTGMFQEEEKLKLYNSFDVFVFSSLAEGFGIVLIEAMASGIPVLCSDLAVLKEVAGETVNYFRTGDSTNLADEMEHMYKELSFERFDADKAKDLVKEKYSMENFVNAYLTLYANLLKEPEKEPEL